MATASGLTRFDGTTFKTFLPDPTDSTSIFTELTSKLLLAKNEKQLWVGTFYGLSVMDLETEKFQNYQFENYQRRDSLSTKVLTRILCIEEDKHGGIWAGTYSDGFFRYIPEQDTFKNYHFPQEKVAPHFPVKRNIDHGLSLLQDRFSDTIMWAGTTAGLLKINTRTDSISWYLYPQKEEKRFTDQNAIRSIYQDKKGLLYLSSWYAGVTVFDPKTKVFSPLPIRNEDAAARAEILEFLSAPIGELTTKNDSTFFISGINGLLTYDVEKKIGLRLQKNDIKKKIFYGIKYQDRQNRVWHKAGNGVHVFNPLTQQFIQYDFDHLNAENFGYTFHFPIKPGSSKLNILAGTSTGIYSIDLKKRQWETFSVDKKYFHPGGAFRPSSYSLAPDGTWTICDRFNIYQYDEQFKSFTPLYVPKIYRDKDYRFLCWDKSERLWIGLHKNGLLRWTPKTNSWNHFKEELTDGHPTVLPNRITKLFEDSQNNLWITRQGGFSIYKSQQDTFYNFLNSINPDNSFAPIAEFAEDQQGRMWISSSGGNLGYALVSNPEKGIVRKFDLQALGGIIRFYKMRADQAGTLWGINKDKLIQIVATGDSLQINAHSLLYGIKDYDDIFGFEILPDGRMVFGGYNKFWLADPKLFLKNPETAKPYLTGISVLQEPLKTNTPVHLVQSLSLGYAENFFSFDFSSISFSQGRENQFRYRLKNFDDKWAAPQKRRFANFTNVPSGDYIFELQVANNEGIWNEAIFQLPVHIATPWWRTAWFWSFFTLGVLGIAYLIYQWRIDQVRKEERLKSSYEKQLADVKMSALRAQMNPHFIFNSLNSIEFYIMNNEQEKAVDYLGRFSRLIRLILQNSKTPQIPLKDELEALKIYMEMESIRFGHLFDYEVKASRGLLQENLVIPPMLIQPYVENAIWHGLRQKQEKAGKIHLDLSKNNGHLICIIEDNGIGREAARKLKSKSAAKRKSFGMKITSDRLNMLNKLNHSNASVKVIDLKNDQGIAIGTRVELTIPIHLNKLES